MKASFGLKNLSLKIKIYAMGGILIATLVTSVLYALFAMNRIGQELVTIAEEDIPLTRVVTEVTIHQLEQAINFERALRYGAAMQEEPAAAKHYEESIDAFRTFSHKIDKEITQGEKIAQEAIALAHSEEERNEFTHVDEMLKKIEKEHAEFAKHAEHAFELISEGKMHEAFEYAEVIEKEEENIDHELESLLYRIEGFTEAAAKTAEHDEQTAFVNLIMISVIGAIIASVIALLIINAILRGVNEAVMVATAIADGDLTNEVHSNSTDEIGMLLTALGVMRDKLHNMITEMNHSSTELAASSEELSAVSEDTNQGIHKQQGEIQQAATAMNEMTAAVQEVAGNAQRTSDSANDANLAAQQGQQVVKANVESIQSLSGVVDNAVAVITQVGHDSDSIGTVLDVIKGIAEQTNLLALNAAIEAARAGEQGRGFAVVADEVRSLAQRTQESTAEIEGMISRLQTSSASAVTTMDLGREQAAKSVEQAIKAGDSLEEITKVISNISDMNAQIASAAEEQTSVSEEVNRNVTVISQVAEQNAAAVNQITASSDELSRMAQNLQNMISQFKI